MNWSSRNSNHIPSCASVFFHDFLKFASPVTPAVLGRVKNMSAVKMQGKEYVCENLVLSDCVYLLGCLVSTPSTWKDVSSSLWFAGYTLGTESVLTELLNQGVSQKSILAFNHQFVKQVIQRLDEGKG